MRISDMITQDECARYFINFSPLLLLEMNSGKKIRIQILTLGFKGLTGPYRRISDWFNVFILQKKNIGVFVKIC